MPADVAQPRRDDNRLSLNVARYAEERRSAPQMDSVSGRFPR